MVIDKTSQCGAESRAVTSIGGYWGWLREENEALYPEDSTCLGTVGCNGPNCHTEDGKSKRWEDNKWTKGRNNKK